ncbi:MAG: hypothetical protein OXM01_09300, partial [Gemmatimonadota bacterium]|nr:hypothetical protein [Gemmatimonadota bacterium]
VKRLMSRYATREDEVDRLGVSKTAIAKLTGVSRTSSVELHDHPGAQIFLLGRVGRGDVGGN